jgi:CRISPR/Cas system CSM-associated protein Csm3 (group 7 of RAMP superfamily)
MHKRFVNHCTIELKIIPEGPILIKSGKEGADPNKTDMEFVETFHQGGQTIYLPGSSLKGAIRAHAERIVRTVGGSQEGQTKIWANDPLSDKYTYLETKEKKKLPSHLLYSKSSFTDQLFGNTSIASRLRIEDAHPVDSQNIRLEERNGVAIDRVFGSVAVGPFNYRVCTGGEFKTRIHLKNFSLAQLGLIGLVLRDLNDGWFGIGFAKSRGMGQVEVEYQKAVVQYPGCILQDGRIHFLGNTTGWVAQPDNMLLGAGMFLDEAERNQYGFPPADHQLLPIRATDMPMGFGVQIEWQGDDERGVPNLFLRAVEAWRKLLGVAV